MLMRVTKPRPALRRVSKTISLAPPIKGLMLSDDISQVPEGGALVLDNWFPKNDVVRARGGSIQRNTGIGGAVGSIMTYNDGATEKVFAFGGGATDSIFDVTSSGAVGAAAVSGLTKAVWSGLQFTTSGGVFLVACGAGNVRRLFNGTSWATTPAVTGVDPSKFSQAWAHGSRLFFVERGTTNAWYLAVDSVGGAATKFPLGGEFKLGGSLVAGATWTTDAGDGLQGACVFVSSEGEVAVYDGIYPSSWSSKGVYRVAKPCGINCFMKAGGDLAIMTEDGLISLTQATSLDRAALANESVSKNIRPLWRRAVSTLDVARWQIVRRDNEGMAIVNAPHAIGGTGNVQFVANLQTGAWARWQGWNATCFAVLANNDLVFGTEDGRIFTGDIGGADDSVPYTCSYVGRFAAERGGKIVTPRLMRATVRSAETFDPQLSVLFDYDTTLPLPPQAGVSNQGSQWDAALWDVGTWAGTLTYQRWKSVVGRGSSYAPCVMVTFGQSTTPDVSILRTDMVLETGEVVA